MENNGGVRQRDTISFSATSLYERSPIPIGFKVLMLVIKVSILVGC